MKSSDVLLKTAVNPKILLQLSHGNFLKSNVAFLLLQTFEIFDKIAKIKTIKTIFMNSSDVLLKIAINTNILIQLSHRHFKKKNRMSFTFV